MAEDAGPDPGDEGEGEDEAGPEAVHRVAVGAAQAGGRLDAVIAAAVAELSRAAVQRLIDEGRVTVGGAVADKAGARVKAGDAIELRVPAPVPLEALPEPIPLAILYEDGEIIVIDKPAGLVVHPAAGHASGTLVNALLFHCRDLSGIGGVARPGIVHRLDKDTSGVMVATKTDRAHAALAAQFAAKSAGQPGGIHREYLAIAAPPPPAPAGTLRTLYGRHPIHRMRFSSKVASGKPAVTHWRIERALAGPGDRPLRAGGALAPPTEGLAALVRLVLETGRTHQIRVHAADHGWPLLGDPVYAPRPRDPRLAAAAAALGRQALHAAVLELAHPSTARRMRFEAPLPEDLQRAISALA